jgi:hypothetical protein
MKCGANGGSPKSNSGSHQNFNGYFSGMLLSLSLSLSFVCVMYRSVLVFLGQKSTPERWQL